MRKWDSLFYTRIVAFKLPASNISLSSEEIGKISSICDATKADMLPRSTKSLPKEDKSPLNIIAWTPNKMSTPKIKIPKRKVRDEIHETPEECEARRRRLYEEIDKFNETVEMKKEAKEKDVFCPVCEKHLLLKSAYDALPSTLKDMYSKYR